MTSVARYLHLHQKKKLNKHQTLLIRSNRKKYLSSNDSCKSKINTCDSSSTNSFGTRRCRTSSCTSNSEHDGDTTTNQNSNGIDFTINDFDYFANGEIDEQQSAAEFARADDDFDMNDQVKSSDEDFTDSYAELIGQKEDVTVTKIEENKIEEILNLVIHRLPGNYELLQLEFWTK